MTSSIRRKLASSLIVSAVATTALSVAAGTANAAGSCTVWENLKPGLSTRVCIDGAGTASKKATVEVRNTTGSHYFLRQMYVQAYPLTGYSYCDSRWALANQTATC